MRVLLSQSYIRLLPTSENLHKGIISIFFNFSQLKQILKYNEEGEATHQVDNTIDL